MTMISGSFAETSEDQASNLKINIQNDSIKYMEKNYTVNSEHYMSIVKFYGKRFMGSVLESMKPLNIPYNS